MTKVRIRFIKELGLCFVFFLLVHHAGAFHGEYSIFKKDNKKGLVNDKGEILIPALYDDLGWSEGEVSLVENSLGYKEEDKWGLLNIKNERVTGPIFTYLKRFTDSRIIAGRKSLYSSKVFYGLIDHKGKEIEEFKYHQLKSNYNRLIAILEKDGHYAQGLLNEKMDIMIPFLFERINPLNNYLYEIGNYEGLRAVFDMNGKGIMDFELDSVSVQEDSSTLIYKNGSVGLVNKTGTSIVRPEYKSIRTDEEGKVVVEKFREWKAFTNKNKFIRSYVYDDISPIAKGLYKVEVGAARTLINLGDTILTPFSKHKIENVHGNWIVIKEGSKSGILRMNGSVFLEPIYDSLYFVDNQVIAKSKMNGEKGWSIINSSGKTITEKVYDEIRWLGATYYMVKEGDFWGVVNVTGKEIIICKYDSIKEYTEGKLLVHYMGEDGILNINGEWEIPPQKKEMEIVDPIRYLVRSPYGSYVSYYPETVDFNAEFFLYKHGNIYLEKTLSNKYGLLDENGEKIIKPEYDEILELQEDSIYVARADSTYSFITKSGKILNDHDPRFEEVRPLSEYFVGVKIDGKWGFVDLNGKLRIANQYENVGEFNEGLAPVKIRNRWGYVDIREDLIIQPYYDTVYHFQGGICEVSKKGKFGLLNAKGQVVLECEYDSICRLKTGGFIISKDNKKGLVSKDGRLLILPRFDDIRDLNNGFVIAGRNGKYGLMSDEGVDIIPMLYEKIKYDPFNDVYLVSKPSEWTNP